VAVTIDDFGASFIHYLPGVIETLNNEVLAKKLTKGSVKRWEGSKLVKYVHVRRNGAINFVEDGGAIPPSARQGYQVAEAYRKFAVGSVGVTDGILNNASTTKHAAIRVVESELDGLMNGMKKFYNYFWTRDGTGVVTLLGATTSGATFTVDDARGLWDQNSYTILDTDGSTVHATFTTQSVARSYNNTLGSATVTPTASVAAGSQAADDYIVWGTGAYSSYNKALTGLDALIDDSASTFQGIDASQWTKYTSPVISSAGTLTPGLIRRMMSMLNQEGGALDGTMDIITTVWLCEKMDELYESAVRITPDTTTVGQSTPTFQSTMGTVRVNQDPDCPYGKMFFMDGSQVTHAVQKELHFRPVSNGGGGIFKRDDAMLRYTATAMEQSELFIEQRNRCGKIEGLTETVSSAF
jgi:hypothetical protein